MYLIKFSANRVGLTPKSSNVKDPGVGVSSMVKRSTSSAVIMGQKEALS